MSLDNDGTVATTMGYGSVSAPRSASSSKPKHPAPGALDGLMIQDDELVGSSHQAVEATDLEKDLQAGAIASEQQDTP